MRDILKVVAIVVFATVAFGASASAATTKPKSAKSAPAVVLTAEEKVAYAQMQKDLNDLDKGETKWPVDTCGAAIPITLDPAMVPAFAKSGRNLAAECESARSKIGTMCRNDEQNLHNGNKEKLSKAVKSISCKLGKGKDVKFSLAGTELIVVLGPECSNVSDDLTPWLVKKGVAKGMD